MTNTNKGYCGTVQNDQGRCYYTYSNGTDQNHSGTIAPQKVNTVTTNTNDYDADDTVTISKTETNYYGTKTAGQDDYTFTFKLVNISTNAERLLAADQPSSTSVYSFVPQNISVAAGSYKAVITTKDSATGRIINSCESAQFVIQNVPTSSIVTYSAQKSTVSATYRYKSGAATNLSSGTSLRAGSVVTLVYTLNNGYTYNASANPVTATGVTPTTTYDSNANTGTIANVNDNDNTVDMEIGGSYYVNVYDVNNGSTAFTTCKPWEDFGHTKNPGKKYVELNETQTLQQIQDKFNLQPAGSVVSDPGITTTRTSFTITGPIGKSTSRTYDLTGENFPASYQGKYTVSYTTRYGYEAAGNDHPILKTETATLWVAFDDITIYVDMNDNVGNPILNFKYYTDANGNPVPHVKISPAS